MTFHSRSTIAFLLPLVCLLSGLPALAQEEQPTRVTVNRPSLEAPAVPRSRYFQFPQGASAEHPLVPALHVAYRSYDFLRDEVREYTCQVVAQERIDGKLREHQFIDAKVRHKLYRDGRVVRPRSVYLKYLHPQEVTGREVLWTDLPGNEMVVRRGGRRFAYLTVTLNPDDEAARRDSRYPIYDMGMKHLVGRLIEKIHRDLLRDECEVQVIPKVKVGGQACYCIQVTHPHPRDHFDFHVARVYVDVKQPLLVRYEAYDWPAEGDDEPVLTEAYTFLKVRLNPDLPEEAFSRDNPEYGFD